MAARLSCTLDLPLHRPKELILGKCERQFWASETVFREARFEGELKAITDRLLEPRPGSLSEMIGNLRAIAMEHLAKLRKLVSKPENVEQTRAVLAEHFGVFKLEPVNESGELKYRAHGKIDFLGGKKVARTGGCRGAGIVPKVLQNPSTSFSIRWVA